MRLRRNEKALPPVRPNAGIAAIYRKKLRALILEMQASYVHFLKAQYRRAPPVMAQDESPAKALERGFAWLKKRLGGLGYDAVYFTSRNPQLIEFAERRLEFTGTAQADGSIRLKAYLMRAA